MASCSARLGMTLAVLMGLIYRADADCLTQPTREGQVIITSSIIPEEAFKDCQELRVLIFAVSNFTIGADAFAGCFSLVAVSFDDSISRAGLNEVRDHFPTCLGLGINTTTSYDTNFSCVPCTRNLVLPTSITSLPEGVYRGCESVVSLTLPTTLSAVPRFAFFQCPSLESIYISQGVQSIDPTAFAGCSNLLRIDFEDAESHPARIDEAFPRCFGLGLYEAPRVVPFRTNYSCLQCSEPTLTIPVDTMTQSAFRSCLMTTVTISSNMNVIPPSAFAFSRLLKNVTIPAAVTYIASSAFTGCSSLEKVEFLGSVVNPASFPSCLGLGSIDSNVASCTTDCSYICIPCRNIANVSVPSTVVSLAEKMFAFCGQVQNIFLPMSIVSIPGGFCDSCTNLVTVDIPPLVTNIGPRAFRNCDNLQSIDFSPALSVIDANAFENCISLNEIVLLPFSTVGVQAFKGCSSLSTVSIPRGVSIHTDTFDSCACQQNRYREGVVLNDCAVGSFSPTMAPSSPSLAPSSIPTMIPITALPSSMPIMPPASVPSSIPVTVNNDASEGRVSVGAIVGVAIAIVALLVLGVILVCRRNQKRRNVQESPFDFAFGPSQFHITNHSINPTAVFEQPGLSAFQLHGVKNLQTEDKEASNNYEYSGFDEPYVAPDPNQPLVYDMNKANPEYALPEDVSTSSSKDSSRNKIHLNEYEYSDMDSGEVSYTDPPIAKQVSYESPDSSQPQVYDMRKATIDYSMPSSTRHAPDVHRKAQTEDDEMC